MNSLELNLSFETNLNHFKLATNRPRRRELASSAGLSMGFSLRMGFDFLTTRFLSEMPAEEAGREY
jgi:hypothetical protein